MKKQPMPFRQPLPSVISRGGFLKTAGMLMAGTGLLGMNACNNAANNAGNENKAGNENPAGNNTGHQGMATGTAAAQPYTGQVVRVAADPTKVPPQPNYTTPRVHQIHITATEAVGEIEPGVLFDYMTFDGQVPAPMIRARQGDTIDLTFTNDAANKNPHNIDFHSVYGTGGGAEALTTGPGQSKRIRFKLLYPGAFIYHCAVPNLDYHISCGMFGMMVVEPPEGLPKVDHEFYIGQNEIYIKKPVSKSLSIFDDDALLAEDPRYVLLNGAAHAITAERYGPMKVKKGETARIFFVNGGPNLSSSFHPIGNVWTKAWRDGGLANNPERYLQTINVPPGSCTVLHMDFPVPETIKLADHSLSRVVRKGLSADIEVSGDPDKGIFDVHPS